MAETAVVGEDKVVLVFVEDDNRIEDSEGALANAITASISLYLNPFISLPNPHHFRIFRHHPHRHRPPPLVFRPIPHPPPRFRRRRSRPRVLRPRGDEAPVDYGETHQHRCADGEEERWGSVACGIEGEEGVCES